MRFRPSNQYDSEYIGANMREVDVKEFREQGINMHPTAVLEDGRAYSDLAWTIIADNTPIAMFGVVPMWQESVRWKKSIGSIWLLGTDDVETFGVECSDLRCWVNRPDHGTPFALCRFGRVWGRPERTSA